MKWRTKNDIWIGLVIGAIVLACFLAWLLT